MRDPVHHAPDAMIAALATGSLPYPFAALLAAHVSLCDECRSRLDAHRVLGGLVLDELTPAALSSDARDRALADIEAEPSVVSAAPRGTYPPPLSAFVGQEGPRWRSLGFGARQAMLWSGPSGTLRLLLIPAGQAVPEHGHRGLELTLVLSGAFWDATGHFQAGDLEVADESLGHTPHATDEAPCICVAATDAPLRFRATIPRLLQPLFGI